MISRQHGSPESKQRGRNEREQEGRKEGGREEREERKGIGAHRSQSNGSRSSQKRLADWESAEEQAQHSTNGVLGELVIIRVGDILRIDEQFRGGHSGLGGGRVISGGSVPDWNTIWQRG